MGLRENCTDKYKAKLAVAGRVPERGDVYDPITQSWSRQHTEEAGLVIGGCCKTGPEEIAALVAGNCLVVGRRCRSLHRTRSSGSHLLLKTSR
ncbi:hypothetical protein A0H81_09416 [Grifola frondosa]|uniref:Hcy-binding domain-containing protein n=1 Tax=Grifola frondosa TaxID=5627 RepID=A0A1C7M1C2_GRIFR|nr:hypothetical protein A0H81_09416 [Grifola frondosa]